MHLTIHRKLYYDKPNNSSTHQRSISKNFSAIRLMRQWYDKAPLTDLLYICTWLISGRKYSSKQN